MQRTSLDSELNKKGYMAKFTRIQVALAMADTGLVPLFYNHDAGICKEVINACYEGGARVFEFTNRSEFAHEVFAEVKRWATDYCQDMMIGAGSVPDAGTASIYMQMGAAFIVSPFLNPETAKACNRRKVLWIPGCGTLTEISEAEEMGAEIVKIFPGNAVGGPSFVRAVKGPCPWTSIMPTGGVEASEDTLTEWVGAGVTCVGLGSLLITEKLVKAGDWTSIQRNVRNTLDIIRKLKTKTP
jgi:2-dehydro-3-deoxyphosphogluconate aldolase/(4S)-4-hydroxy-2-oxoglutarate aldolase